jgi:thioredoxin reductase
MPIGPRPAPPAEVDVLIIGGGPAGLSAALTLGRSRRSVLVVDDGAPRNAPAAAMHAFLTREGTPPAELLALGRDEVARYDVALHDARAITATRLNGYLHIGLNDGSTISARQVVVTTGLVDELPDVDGLAERWGRDVVHCPYCHGWEVRDQVIGVLATSPMALHQAGLFRQLSDRVVVLRHIVGEFDADRLEALAARGVEVVDGQVTALEVHDDRLSGVRLAHGRMVALDVLAVASRVTVRDGLLNELGVGTAEHPSGMGRHVPADAMGRTKVAGVWVAGNVTDPSAQVIVAAAQGNRVGALVNAELVTEDETQAIAQRRQNA